MAFSGREAINRATCVINNLLTDKESHTDAFAINLTFWVTLNLNFSEKREKLMHFAFFDTSTSICNMHNEQLPVRAEARFNFDVLPVRKLKCIFCQVYQDLFKTNLVANNFFWQLVRYHFWHGKIIYIFSRQRQALNYLKAEGCILHFSMLPEDVNDKFESLKRIEFLQSCYKAILLNHLQIQDVVH